jgi:bisphosphoglycerate-independent phosphoglycerate mutase (AlkP superfamily)
MAQAPVSPVVLVILDGWGYREATEGNALAAANTPVMDSLWGRMWGYQKVKWVTQKWVT